MSQPAFSIDAVPTVNPHSQKLAHIRQQILTLFLDDEEFVHALVENDQHVSIMTKQLVKKLVL